MRISKVEFYKTVAHKYLPNEHQSILILRDVEAEELNPNIIIIKKGNIFTDYIETYEEILQKMKNTHDLKLSIDAVELNNLIVNKALVDDLGCICIELSVVNGKYTGDMRYSGGVINKFEKSSVGKLNENNTTEGYFGKVKGFAISNSDVIGITGISEKDLNVKNVDGLDFKRIADQLYQELKKENK